MYVGGVGFDINCGVRLLRTNLFEKDVAPIKEQLAQVHNRHSHIQLLFDAEVPLLSLSLFLCSLCLIISQLELVLRVSYQ